MQLLVVHREAEIGEALVELVRGYSEHEADYVVSNDAALDWIAQHPDVALIISQLEGEGIDGLALADSLGKKARAVQIFFLPAYARAEQRLEIARTKIFPEPIEGEELLQAIARVAETAGTLPNEFQIAELLQMLCLSGKSGALDFFAGEDSGVVFLRNGQLPHAATVSNTGLDALAEMFSWGAGQFSFEANANAPDETIEASWDSALLEVLARQHAVAHGSLSLAIEPAQLPPEPDLSGTQFGSYRIGDKLGETFWDSIYEAEQTTIGRQVVLHVLRNSLRAIPERAQEFLDTASANANVRHPAILPVYEAGECEGTYFYAREFIVGRTLYEIRAAGLTISALLALRIIRATAEAFAHLDDHQILHAPLWLTRIFVTPNDEARLADLAVAGSAMAQLEPAQTEIQMLGRVLIPMTKATALAGSGRVLKLIHQMQTTGEEAIAGWPALAAEAKKLEAVLVPPPIAAPHRTGLMEKVKFWGK